MIRPLAEILADVRAEASLLGHPHTRPADDVARLSRINLLYAELIEGYLAS
jgi:hypothetical protein